MKHLHSVDYNKLDEEMCKNPHFQSIEYNLTVDGFVTKTFISAFKTCTNQLKGF